MRAQRFTVTVTVTGVHPEAAPFTAEEIEEALRAKFPGSFREGYGSHTVKVAVAR